MTLYVNNSLLSLLRTCESKAYIRWGRELVMQAPEQAGPMAIGRVIHRMMEGWFQGELCDFPSIWTAEVGDQLPDSERLYPENVRKIFQHWAMAQLGQGRKVGMLETELLLEAPLGKVNGEEVIFYGTIDALIDWTGSMWLMDHKTTGNMDSSWESQWKMSAQLQGYVWLLKENGYHVKGAFVNGLEIRKLPPWDGNMNKKCASHKVKYEECQGLHVKHAWVGPLVWSPSRLDQWKQDALKMSGRLHAIREVVEQKYPMTMIQMDGQFTWPGCGRCQYQSWCEAGRPLAGLERMMVHEAWRGPGQPVNEEEACEEENNPG